MLARARGVALDPSPGTGEGGERESASRVRE